MRAGTFAERNPLDSWFGSSVPTRKGEWGDPKNMALAKTFNHVLNQAPAYTGTVYRGVHLPADNPIFSLKPGDHFVFNASSSAFKKLAVAQNFASQAWDNEQIVLQIKTRTGVDISNLTRTYAKEQEVVMRHGSKHRVTHVEKKGEITYVSMEEVDA